MAEQKQRQKDCGITHGCTPVSQCTPVHKCTHSLTHSVPQSHGCTHSLTHSEPQSHRCTHSLIHGVPQSHSWCTPVSLMGAPESHPCVYHSLTHGVPQSHSWVYPKQPGDILLGPTFKGSTTVRQGLLCLKFQPWGNWARESRIPGWPRE